MTQNMNDQQQNIAMLTLFFTYDANSMTRLVKENGQFKNLATAYDMAPDNGTAEQQHVHDQSAAMPVAGKLPEIDMQQLQQAAKEFMAAVQRGSAQSSNTAAPANPTNSDKAMAQRRMQMLQLMLQRQNEYSAA